MKLIKKIVAIMFAFMMVVSMSCNVKADEGTSSTKKGTITITNAKEGETYKLYKILSLESYSYTGNDKDNGNYAYTLTGDTKWDNFIETKATDYFEFDKTNTYLTWKGSTDETRVKEFAQLALKYARTKSNNVQPLKEVERTKSSTVKFDDLDLGYYLVDSSVGSLCVLNTTNPDLTIAEKNGVPSVEKGVSNIQNGTYESTNNASIGDTVYFQTTITAQPGAQNYVLHDKMTKGLTLKNDSIVVKKGESPVATSYYTLKTSDFNDDCTFEIVFGQTFCDDLQKDEKITVTYSATLNENAVIAGEGNKNETWLKYGENNNLETTHTTTDTKTFEMNVFKFYEDKNNSNTEKGLAGATFKLTKDSQDAVNIGFVKTSNETATDDVYRVAKTGETGTVTTITSPDSGKFTIKGLSAGTYKLEETKQPAGYNKLSGPVTVVIDMDGKVTVGGTEVTQVDVENKTGTVLPSTGGMGTTMIYLIGGVLVLGSGVVLVTKRRVKGK